MIYGKVELCHMIQFDKHNMDSTKASLDQSDYYNIEKIQERILDLVASELAKTQLSEKPLSEEQLNKNTTQTLENIVRVSSKMLQDLQEKTLVMRDDCERYLQVEQKEERYQQLSPFSPVKTNTKAALDRGLSAISLFNLSASTSKQQRSPEGNSESQLLSSDKKTVPTPERIQLERFLFGKSEERAIRAQDVLRRSASAIKRATKLLKRLERRKQA